MLENKAFKNTFCWGPDGTTFIVKDTNEFSKGILPKHFKHCNFASFVRQLNKYDFHKVRNADDGHKPYGDQAWEFVHPKFRRDRKDLLEEIRRKTPGKAKKEEPSLVTSNITSSSTRAKEKTSSSDAPLTQQEDEDQSNESFLEIRQLADTLQLQIAQLQQTQKDMEGTLQRLHHNDTFILNEFVKLGKTMEAKDDLIKQLFHIVADHEKNGPLSDTSLHRDRSIGLDMQTLLDRYTKISESTAQQINNITKQLTQPNWSHASSISPPESTIPSQPDPPMLPVIGYAQDPQTAAVAAAAVNAGSIVGSPLKTADGLAFVTVGRIKQPTDDKVANCLQQCENIAIPSNSSAPQQQNPLTAVASGSGNISNPLSMTRRPNGSGWTVPPRVLLVDDDSVYRDLSGKLLNMIGCTIDLAKDGVEAIRKMGIEKYDLILMDIVMPNLDGISATRNIRQYDLMTPIISMTSNFTDSDIMQYVGSGMTDILPKPFSKRTLYSMLEKYCAHLKVIQRIQEPNSLPRELGNIEILPEGQISEINPRNSSDTGSAGAFIKEVSTQSEATAATVSSIPVTIPSIPTQQQQSSIMPTPAPLQPSTPHPSISASNDPLSGYSIVPMDRTQQPNPGAAHVAPYHHPVAMASNTEQSVVWAPPPSQQQQQQQQQQQAMSAPAMQRPVIPSNDGKRAWAQACLQTPRPQQHEFSFAASTLAAKRRKQG
ncbi:hypothetical protein BX666DRAFT_2027393 [Dichotomocladium elegans]|nr:hypothetical protein BX666DRAFT_2027393 [Dichotomocladium elegans]